MFNKYKTIRYLLKLKLDVVNKLRSFRSLQKLDRLTDKDESTKIQTLSVLHI